MKQMIALMATAALAACGEGPPPPAEPTPAAEAPAPGASQYSATPAPGEELPTSQTTPGPIPLEFRHVWAIETADCTGEPGLTRIAIAPGAIRFYEGRSVVVSAEAPHEGALALQVDHMAEGQTSREAHTLALDEAKTALTYNRGGSNFTYKRCD
jgi:hypothetical protein